MADERCFEGRESLAERIRWCRWLSAWIAVGVILVPLVVLAHAQLLRSKPGQKEELVKAPTQVELWFNELLDAGFNSLTVYPAEQAQTKGRTNLIQGKPLLDPQDRTHLTAQVAPLTPGDYMVEWRVLSRDGHSAPGRLTFRVLSPK